MTEHKLDWSVKTPFIQRRTVVADDQDAFGHVTNVRYIDWAMGIAWSHTNALGLSFADYERLGVGCVVWRHEFDYLAAARAGDDLAIATWISKNDNRIRLTRAFEMRLVSNGKVLFRGQTTFVAIDMKTGKPTRMPREFIEAYQPAQ